MALSAGDLGIIARWCGEIEPEDEADHDERVTRLGSPYAAALEWLMIRRGTFIATEAKLASGDERLDHTENPAWVEAQISRLVATIEASDTITLSGAGEELLAEARAPEASRTLLVSMAAPNPRRG